MLWILYSQALTHPQNQNLRHLKSDIDKRNHFVQTYLNHFAMQNLFVVQSKTFGMLHSKVAHVDNWQ